MNSFLEYLYSSTILRWLTESLWRDEAFSVLLARKNLFEIVYLAAKDYTPPLYYIILKFWMEIFGSSEIVIRALSMIFYLGSLVMFVIILEKFKIKDKIIYLATAVLATAPGFIYYAFEARPYSLLAFLTLVNFYAFVQQRSRLYFTSLILGFFTHYFFIFNLIAQVCYVIFVEKRRGKKFLKTWSIFGIIVGVWLGYLVYLRSYLFSSDFWVDRLSFKDTTEAFLVIWVGFIKGWESRYNFFSIYALFFTLLILASVFVIIKSYRERQKSSFSKVGFLILLFSLLPIMILIFISIIKPVFIARYVLFTIPFLILLFVFAFKRRVLVLILTLLFVFNLSYLSFLVEARKKLEWRKILGELRLYLNPKQRVYLSVASEYPVFVYYLPEIKDKIFVLEKNYDSLPGYIGKVIYPKDKVVADFMSFSYPALVFNPYGKMIIHEFR